MVVQVEFVRFLAVIHVRMTPPVSHCYTLSFDKARAGLHRAGRQAEPGSSAAFDVCGGWAPPLPVRSIGRPRGYGTPFDPGMAHLHSQRGKLQLVDLRDTKRIHSRSLLAAVCLPERWKRDLPRIASSRAEDWRRISYDGCSPASGAVRDPGAPTITGSIGQIVRIHLAKRPMFTMMQPAICAVARGGVEGVTISLKTLLQEVKAAPGRRTW